MTCSSEKLEMNAEKKDSFRRMARCIIPGRAQQYKRAATYELAQKRNGIGKEFIRNASPPQIKR